MKKLRLISLLLAFCIPFVFLSTCKKDKEDITELQTQNTGTVEGMVFAENGTTVIPAANVFIDVDGAIFFTKTCNQGMFELKAPEGEHILHIQTGQGTIFRTYMEVIVEKNKVTHIADGDIKLTQVAALAYVTGAYDEIESIIDSLGYQATEIQLTDLHNTTLLDGYAAIFFNCGIGNLDTTMWNNLKLYVGNGGSIYVSDWAVKSLTGNLNTSKMQARSANTHQFKTHKNCPSRPGGFIHEDTLCTQRHGPALTVQNATVVDPNIETWLGTNSIDVYYDLGAWEVINVLANIWDVLIEDNVQGYGPLAVRTTYNPAATSKGGGGNNQQWITICHYPPGNPNNPQTITIPISAWPAHQAHGCQIGPCQGAGGQIVFTTFHNHPGGTLSQDIKKIIEYFIINL